MLKHPYISHINNLLLTPDLFVKPMMTCLWRYYWLHDVLLRRKVFLPNYLNHDVISWKSWVDSQFWIILWTLLRLVKLLTKFEHHYCSRTYVKMRGGWWGGGEGKKPLHCVFEAHKNLCQIRLKCKKNVSFWENWH